MKKALLALALVCSTSASAFDGLPTSGVETPSPLSTEFAFPYLTNGYHNSVLRTWVNTAMKEADAEFQKTGEISQVVNENYISMNSSGYKYWNDSDDRATTSPAADMKALSNLAMAPLKWACTVSGGCYDNGYEYTLRMNADSSNFDVNGTLHVGWANLRRESCALAYGGVRVCTTIDDMNYGGDLAGFWIKAIDWINEKENLSNIQTSIDQVKKTFDRPYVTVNATLIPGKVSGGDISYFHMADPEWWTLWQRQVNLNSVAIGYKLGQIEPILAGDHAGLRQSYLPQDEQWAGKYGSHLAGALPLYEYNPLRALEIVHRQRMQLPLGDYAQFDNNYKACRVNLMMTGDDGYLPSPGYYGVTALYGIAPQYTPVLQLATFAWSANTKSQSKMYEMANYDHNARVFLHELGHNYDYGHDTTPSADSYWNDLSVTVPSFIDDRRSDDQCVNRVL
ncbi:hypothetical protein VPFG_00156 [Vibrio phage nt-1]|uniref:Uncharacterized protein n=1 Tax=Vibrio phage nt-1 TaxID=115992 RepID=R9TGD5_9CAUD|nr:hypothetical protein VPFG_00156 [Vibrio phage nt-1]AGN30158.1 hypothetical protein VPFG_00156 [Vibrio phage nt-1]